MHFGLPVVPDEYNTYHGWSKGSGTVATLKVVLGPKATAGKAEVKVKFAEPAGAELALPVRWGK